MDENSTINGQVKHHPRDDITDQVIAEWAEHRADDAGALARRIVALRERAEAAQKNYLDTRMEVKMLEEAHDTVSGALANALEQLMEARAALAKIAQEG